MSKDIPILIPSYNPDHRLPELVETLIRKGVKHIIVVDDGSQEECNPIFKRLESLESCTVLRHAVNCGKGRALKTGLNHFYLHFHGSPGIVTADGDGQHQPSDILKVVLALKENPGNLIMGVRKLGRKIPFRSLFGNVLTRFVFSFLIGKKISDTQSGLRGIPFSTVPQLLKASGERYEYEINMLILTKVKSIDIIEIPIDTIYIDDNKSSHFNPLIDSMRIYFLLFRFLFSSLFAALIDFITFTTIYFLFKNILAAIVVARTTSGIVNFLINKNIVFKHKKKVFLTFFKFAVLLMLRGGISYMLIKKVIPYFSLGVLGAYILVESLLFFANFAIQRDFVFYNEEKEY